jgi:multiple sugar transport system ATP-binding protein
MIETAAGIVRVRVGKEVRLAVGSPVRLSFRNERALLYDAVSGRRLPAAELASAETGDVHG